MQLIRMPIALAAGLLGLVLALPVLVLAAPFWGVALLTRFIARLLEPRYVPWQEIIEFSPGIGWRAKANLDTYYLADRDDVYRVITDGHGWPGKTGVAESNVVVFGDSHAFGFGVDPARSFWGRDPNLRIKAIGAPGYNLVQELLLMREYSEQLRDKLVIWFVYAGNDLFDNLSPAMRHYRMPFVRRNDGQEWEIVNDHLSPQPWSHSTARGIRRRVMVSLHSQTSLAQRAYSACDFLIAEARQVCDRAGARLVVFTIPWRHAFSPKVLARIRQTSADPHSFDAGLPDHALDEVCSKHQVLHVPGWRVLSVRDFKPHDHHWNEQGHRRVAEIISRLHQSYRAGTLGTGDGDNTLFARASR